MITWIAHNKSGKGWRLESLRHYAYRYCSMNDYPAWSNGDIGGKPAQAQGYTSPRGDFRITSNYRVVTNPQAVRHDDVLKF